MTVAGGRATGRSLRSGFVWNLAGSIAYNLSQWLLVVGLARLGNPAVVGTFTLLMAVAAPVFLTGGLNLRTVQLTDAQRRYTLDDYLALRALTSAAAFVVCLVLGAFMSLSAATMSALIFVALAKVIENLSLSHYGYYSLLERFDLVGRSMMARAVLGPLLFGVAYWSTGRLWLACAALAFAWMVVGVHDNQRVRSLATAEGRPRGGWRAADGRRVRSLLRRSWPLGLDQGVSSLTVNLPRYGIEALLGTARLGVYAGQAYLAQVLTMITMAMTGVFVPRMARAFAAGQRRAFVRDLVRLTLAALALTLISVVLAVVVGEWFLAVTLGEAYAQRGLLVVLMVASGFVTVQRVLSKALEASHQFRSYMLIDIITLVAVGLPLLPLVQRYGTVGAAAASAIGYAVGASVMGLFVIRIVRGMPTHAGAAGHVE